MSNSRDELCFHEAAAAFFSSLLWATIIIVAGTVVTYFVL
jgi:hypothetical protein